MHVHCTAARFFYSLCCWPRDRVTLTSLATSRDSDIARLQQLTALYLSAGSEHSCSEDEVLEAEQQDDLNEGTQDNSVGNLL